MSSSTECQLRSTSFIKNRGRRLDEDINLLRDKSYFQFSKSSLFKVSDSSLIGLYWPWSNFLDERSCKRLIKSWSLVRVDQDPGGHGSRRYEGSLPHLWVTPRPLRSNVTCVGAGGLSVTHGVWCGVLSALSSRLRRHRLPRFERSLDQSFPWRQSVFYFRVTCLVTGKRFNCLW